MTRLDRSRPVRRVVTSALGRELVVMLIPSGIMVREPRRRTWFGPLDYGQLHLELIRRQHEARKRARRRRRS
jgi:hypothetical protein